MRIGELLVEQRKLRQSELTRAIVDKPADKRMCSFLIARGLVDFDDSSRALGEQQGVACALAKHLEGRDPELAKLIPAELGRASCALPLGRSSRGALIVCVRDPSPSVLAALRQAANTEITMVIAPATRLEHLVLNAYGAAPSDEFDIDFSTTGMGDNLVTSPPRVAAMAAASANLPPIPDVAALDPESVRLALTDLDDERVDKDPTQSGKLPAFAQPVPVTIPTPTISRRATTSDPRVTRPMSLSAMAVGLEHATSRETATDLVLAYVATRWKSGLVLAIRDRSAAGYRGHGVSMPELISLPLGVPSTVQIAVESKFVSVVSPSGPAQDALVRALGGATPAAAPVVVNGSAVAVVVVGHPLDRDTTVEHAAADLGMLAEALGSAYTRIAR
jgi:Type II secretion system (T2SS), protein E, N-terminal domain